MKWKNHFCESFLRCFLLVLCVFTGPGLFATATEVFAQTGNLHVVITPQEATDDGAQWRVDGGTWRNSGGYVALETGSHTVEFKTVTGWYTPTSQPVVITGGQITEVAGAYTRVRDLKVFITPQGAVDDGAKWNVDGKDWGDSGATVTVLFAGDHTVNYKSVSGWIAPASETVVINDGETTEITRAYTPKGALKVTITPQAVIDEGAQWNVDAGDWQSSATTLVGLSVGNHTVNYKPVFGWNTPNSLIVRVLKSNF